MRPKRDAEEAENLWRRHLAGGFAPRGGIQNRRKMPARQDRARLRDLRGSWSAAQLENLRTADQNDVLVRAPAIGAVPWCNNVAA